MGAFIRPAVAGEFVETILSGKKECGNTAQAGDFVIQANTAEKERYILNPEKFERCYHPEGATVMADHVDAKQLQSDGFRAFRCKGKIVAIEATPALLESAIPGGQFLASWGTPMLVEAGDFLACPVRPEATGAPESLGEVYRIEKSAFAQT